ncbi:MAG: hypothetical protein R2838_20520 [Caldilineaceae bacterium]
MTATMTPPSAFGLGARAPLVENDAPLDDDYIAMVQMVGPEGVWGDRLYRENEALRRWPTSTWTPGTLMRDEVDVNLTRSRRRASIPSSSA